MFLKKAGFQQKSLCIIFTKFAIKVYKEISKLIIKYTHIQCTPSRYRYQFFDIAIIP